MLCFNRWTAGHRPVSAIDCNDRTGGLKQSAWRRRSRSAGRREIVDKVGLIDPDLPASAVDLRKSAPFQDWRLPPGPRQACAAAMIKRTGTWYRLRTRSWSKLSPLVARSRAGAIGHRVFAQRTQAKRMFAASELPSATNKSLCERILPRLCHLVLQSRSHLWAPHRRPC
jgi:hypothetical protein